MKLTTAIARSLTLPDRVKSDRTFFDDDLPAFGVRVRHSGEARYVVQYKIGKKNRRKVLGSVRALDATKARTMAKDILAAIRFGRDPVAENFEERLRAGETFGALLPRFLARQRERLKPRSYVETERHLVVQSRSLHVRAVERIDRRAIAALLGDLNDNNGPGAANRCRASLSAYFTWLAKEGVVEANPVTFTNKAIEKGERRHVPSDGDLAKIWRGLGGDPYSSIIKLLMLLGSRRDEVGGLRWSEIDFERELITLSPARTKSRREFLIPLSPGAIRILRAQPKRLLPDGSESDFVFGFANRGFQDWSGSKAELDGRLKGVAPWVLHDFRRALSTAMHERFSVLPHVVESVLGHVSGHQGGIAGRYNKAAYIDERRRALRLWADHIASLVGEKPSGKVVKLRA